MFISTFLDTKKAYIKDGDRMKKYVISILFGLIVGFFLGKTLLEEYHSYNGIKVSVSGVNAYFIKYGEYDSLDNLEKGTLALANYIYTEKDGKYSAYVGITTNEDNCQKLEDYFKKLGYEVVIEEYVLNNNTYINYLENADKLLSNTTDEAVIGEVCSQILSKYEELVIDDGKNA